MAGSERAVVVGLAALAATIAACDALIGLGQYHDVDCAFDCGLDGGDSSFIGVPDAFESGPHLEGGATADASDAETGGPPLEGGVPESGWPVPTGHLLWAHWPMPNPDASTAPDSSTPLPHTMTYDAGLDGGVEGGSASPVVVDVVTGLTWSGPYTAGTLSNAWLSCTGLGSGWRVPTRIELVSLVDFTQAPPQATIDPVAFPGVSASSGLFWTSSAVPGDEGPFAIWTVSFQSGLAGYDVQASNVLCVKGGTQ